jgi:hypothetical protein
MLWRMAVVGYIRVLARYLPEGTKISNKNPQSGSVSQPRFEPIISGAWDRSVTS